MNKRYTIIVLVMVGIFLFGGMGFAIGVISQDETADIGQRAKAGLNSIGVDNTDKPSLIGYGVDDVGDQMYFCLEHDSLHTCSRLMDTFTEECTGGITIDANFDNICNRLVRTDLTLAEKQAMGNAWMDERLEGIGNIIEDRKEDGVLDKTRVGEISFVR